MTTRRRTFELRSNRKYPFIPTVTDDPQSHTLALRALIEAVAIHERRTQDIDYSFVRVHELEDMGLITIKDGQFNVVDVELGDLADVDLDIDPGSADDGTILVVEGQDWTLGDHGDIAGLGDDDHPQYTAWAQAESIIGQWQWSTSLWGPNGTEGAPSFSFTNDQDTGVYRVGANQLGLSTGGTLRLTVDGAVSITSTLPHYAPNGSNSIPAYTFSGDTNTGMYHVGADNVGLATGGVLHWDMNTTRTFQNVYGVIRNYQGLFIENPDYLNAGVEITTVTGTDPLNNGIGNQIAFWEVGVGGAFTDRSYGFRMRHTGEVNLEGNLDFYRHTNDTVGILFMRFTRESSQVQFADGAASTPIITNIGDENTGMYFPGADEVGFATGGNLKLTVTGQIIATVPYHTASGSNSLPAYSFTADPNTGMYRIGADNLGIATGGVLRWDVSTTLITAALPINVPTIDLGAAATDTTLSRASAGVLAVEGHNVPTVDQAQTISAQYTFTVAPLFANTLSPAQITTNQDNYAPAGIGNATHLRLNTDATREITGITTGANGRFLIISNVGAFVLIFKHDVTSTAANRFFFDDGADMTLGTEETRLFWYDTTTQRWRTLMAGGASGSGTVDSIVEGEAIVVDASDPANPIVGIDIPSLAADASPDSLNDYIMTYDDSAGLHKKVLLDDLPGGSGGGSGMIVRYDVYTADDTWTKPDGFSFGIAIGIGQGGGGASGRLGIAGGGRVGGGGGGGGGRSVVNFIDADAGPTESINVNGGGTGGAARTTTAQDGANGVAGEATTFGSILTANGGGGGTGGTNTGNSAAGAGGTGNNGNGSTGGTGFATTQTTPVAIAGGSTGAGGGGGGAGVTGANADGVGVAGAASAFAAGGSAPAGSPPGGDGGAGGSVGDNYNGGGGGGGSGNGSDVSTTLGGDGGVGGQWGGGGGGGGGSTLLVATGESGAGGNGGSGVLLVLSWCNVGAGTGLVDAVTSDDGSITVDISDPTQPDLAINLAHDFTWTGDHVFNEPIIVSNAGPSMVQIETDQATDAKRWTARVAAGVYSIGATLDDSTVFRAGLAITRNPASSAITNVSIGNATNNPTIQLLGSGAVSIGGAVTSAGIISSTAGRVEVHGTTAQIYFDETDQGSDLKIWRALASAGSWALQTRTDADGAGANAISFDRSTTTVTAIQFGSTAQDTQLQIPSVNDAATPTFAFLSDLDTGFYRVGANNIGFAAGATLCFQYGTDFIDHLRAIRETGVISPAQLVANTDNWNPTGLASASIIRLSTDASRNITGIVAQATGTRLTLINVGAQNAVLVHDATSTAGNRFFCPGAANFTLNTMDSVDIWYDNTSSRWRVIAY